MEPGIAPYEKEINGLEEMQATVGGLITTSYPFEEPVAIVSNDESIGMGLPFNRTIESGYGGIFGTFFVCGLTEDSFCSLTPEQMAFYKEKYHSAEFLLAVKGDEMTTLKVPPRPHDPGAHPPHHPKQK